MALARLTAGCVPTILILSLRVTSAVTPLALGNCSRVFLVLYCFLFSAKIVLDGSHNFQSPFFFDYFYDRPHNVIHNFKIGFFSEWTGQIAKTQKIKDALTINLSYAQLGIMLSCFEMDLIK